MTFDEAKDLLLEVCESPLAMDVAEISRGLERWGYQVKEYERLTDPDPETLQEYMLWIECGYGIELARRNIAVWLAELKDWPWLGHWHFVTYYYKPGQSSAEFTWQVCRFLGGFTRLRNVGVEPPWTAWQRRSGQPPEHLYAKQIVWKWDHKKSEKTEVPAPGGEGLQQKVRCVCGQEGLGARAA